MEIKEEEAARKDDPAPITTQYSASSLCEMASAGKESVLLHICVTQNVHHNRETPKATPTKEREDSTKDLEPPPNSIGISPPYDLVNDND